MSMNMKFDPRSQAKMNQAISELARESGKTLKEVLPSQMRLLATDLAYNTTPKGKTKGVEIPNMRDVKARIKSIYPSAGIVIYWVKSKNEGAAGSLASYIELKKRAKAQAIIDKYIPEKKVTVGGFDGGKLHRNNSRSKSIKSRLLVFGYTRVTSYANKTAKKVGYAKGGFATAARMLGGARGIPSFAKRQKAPGRGIVTGSGKTLSVTLVNDVRHIRDSLSKADEVMALKNRELMVGKVLTRVQMRKVTKTMRKYK